MKPEASHDRLGLAHWMRQVMVECEHARRDFSADSVHDLRVALRRCRSLAAVIERVDPYSGSALSAGGPGGLRDPGICGGKGSRAEAGGGNGTGAI